MYDPKTVAHEIKYPWRAHSKKWCDDRKEKPDSFFRRYRSSFITIWHVDPEKPNTGNRRDDSCGWFDRTPGAYADAVAYVLKDTTFVHAVNLTLARKVMTNAPFYEGVSKEQLAWPRLTYADTLALTLQIANELETRRWWNGQNGKRGAHSSFWARVLSPRRSVIELATSLALNPSDNLSSPETVESAVRLVAAALNRRFRPWWKHPRWHVHHWKFQVHPWQQFKRWALHRCAHCKKGFKWGYSPVSHGGDAIYHEQCSSVVWARDHKLQPDPHGIADAMSPASGAVH